MFVSSFAKKSAVAGVSLLAVTLSGCTSTEEQIATDMKPAVSKHDGAWTEDALRAAAGKHADMIETITVTEDGSGGAVYFVTHSENKGDTYTDRKTRKSSSGKTKTTTTTKTRDEWEKDCISVTVTGQTLTTATYEQESSTAPVTCAPAS